MPLDIKAYLDKLAQKPLSELTRDELTALAYCRNKALDACDSLVNEQERYIKELEGFIGQLKEQVNGLQETISAQMHVIAIFSELPNRTSKTIQKKAGRPLKHTDERLFELLLMVERMKREHPDFLEGKPSSVGDGVALRNNFAKMFKEFGRAEYRARAVNFKTLLNNVSGARSALRRSAELGTPSPNFGYTIEQNEQIRYAILNGEQIPSFPKTPQFFRKT